MNPELERLKRTYLKYGRVEAGEILLSPERAVAFIDDLERLGVRIYGLDFWRDHNGNPVEIPWGGGYDDSMSVAERAESARRTIIDRRPSDIVYVSLVFEGFAVRDM